MKNSQPKEGKTEWLAGVHPRKRGAFAVLKNCARGANGPDLSINHTSYLVPKFTVVAGPQLSDKSALIGAIALAIAPLYRATIITRSTTCGDLTDKSTQKDGENYSPLLYVKLRQPG